MGILAPITDIMARLKAIQTTNQMGVTGDTHVRIWNNQKERGIEGTEQYEPLPSLYLEYMADADFMAIGGGYLASDPIWRIHILHENYNNADSIGTTFEQDLIVFGIRDQVLKALNRFKPAASGALSYVGEQPDYDHANVYEYQVDFTGHFIDDSGSDENSGDFIIKDPPTELEIEVHVLKTGDIQLTENEFIIDGKVNRTD